MRVAATASTKVPRGLSPSQRRRRRGCGRRAARSVRHDPSGTDEADAVAEEPAAEEGETTAAANSDAPVVWTSQGRPQARRTHRNRPDQTPNSTPLPMRSPQRKDLPPSGSRRLCRRKTEPWVSSLTHNRSTFLLTVSPAHSNVPR